jgi:hypothetical protein
MAVEAAAVCAELAGLEPIFHHPELTGTTRADFDASTVADFWEVGASGTVYEREYVWEILEQRYRDPTYVDEWATSDFFCRALGSDTYLLTYLLHEGERVTRRSTVWRRGERTWQVVYHQGTIITDR